MDSASSSPGPLKELTTSRARFIAELGERIAALRQGLARMATLAEPTAELNAVRRRLHAMAAAAEVLRFTTSAEALAEAEASLATSAGAAPAAPARERVARILDLLPSLVVGAALDLGAELDPQRHRVLREPLCVLVYGDPELEALLRAPGPLRGVETHLSADPEHVVGAIERLGPDVVLLDGDAEGVCELIPRMRQAAGSRRTPLVAVARFDQHEPLFRLMRRGVARLQPRPIDAGTLQRTLRQVSPITAPPPARTADFRQLTPDQLVEAIAAEARKAFTEPESSAQPAPAIDFGSGAEVLASLWGAFARIRELAVSASEGVVRFPAAGPHGAVALAPTAAQPERRAQPAQASPSKPLAVNLAGRRFIVVEEDAAVLALLARALQQLGAVVLPARDTALALQLAQRHWPDALISGPLMPGRDGFELCQELREDIALADLPVALVTWREQLLERARLAGDTRSAASAALNPGSIAPVLEACLLERASIERRLTSSEEAHGRIDGLTPRLLLQLVCSRTPNALLTLSSGRLRYELSVVDGRPVRAELYADEQSVGQGEAVLGPLLGVRAGRFSVGPLLATPTPHFTGDLMTVLEPAIQRARRAQARLRAGDVSVIERVLLDPHAVAQYLEGAPAAQRPLVARLQAGAPPRSLAPIEDAGEAQRTLATLLELCRRGAVLGLLDAAGDDVLAERGAPSPSSLHAGSEPPPPAVPSIPQREGAPVVALGEAVLQAVCAPPPPAPRADRTQPGLAPATPPPPAAVALSAPASEAPPVPGQPREVLEAWSSEPDEEEEDDATTEGADADADAELTEQPLGSEGVARPPAPLSGSDGLDWPASPGARLLSIGGPLLITLGAGALAFFGVRAVADGGWQTLSAALRGGPAPAAADAGAVEELAALPESPTEPTPDDGLGLAEQRKVPVGVSFKSELLELPPHTRLRPGHGLLEVHTWERQRIYVDGVFMGNYESRLIPLNPGTYQLLLRDGAREMVRSVQVEAGRRTRLSASPKSPQ